MSDPDAPLTDARERWPVSETQDVYRGSAPFAVRQDRLTAPSGGEPFWRVVVEHPGAVVVLAVDDRDRALVLRQYRHPVGMRLVELPAGLLDVPGEDPLVAARRELLEEGGIEAEEWVRLHAVLNSPGFTDERIEIYLARSLREADGRDGFVAEHEEAEMTADWVPVADLLEGILEQRLVDGPLAIAVLTYVAGGWSARHPAFGSGRL